MLEKVSGQKTLSCNASCQEVSRCYPRGESKERIGEEAHKCGIHPGFHTRSLKQGVSGPTKRTDVLQ